MKGNWDRCPLCGSRRVQKNTGDISIQTASGVVQVPRVEYHECTDCGERFFDYEASKIVDQHCLRKVAAQKK